MRNGAIPSERGAKKRETLVLEGEGDRERRLALSLIHLQVSNLPVDTVIRGSIRLRY